MKNKSRYIAHAAIISALYVVLTYISNLFGLANGAIQIRFSEALTVLPVFTPSAIPGLFFGCLISNILSGCVIWDIIFGSLATLLGAILTSVIKKYKYIASVPPIISNTIIIPFVLKFAYGLPSGLSYLIITVCAGEILSCGVLGTLLMLYLEKHKNRFNW